MNTENGKLQLNVFNANLRRFKKVALIAGIVGGLVGLCFVLAHLILADHPSWRGVFIFPFACGFGISAMTTGIALLFAPDEFFSSDEGQKYLAAIGTTNVTTARVVIVIGLLVGCAFFALIGALILQMMGLIMLPGSAGRFA